MLVFGDGGVWCVWGGEREREVAISLHTPPNKTKRNTPPTPTAQQPPACHPQPPTLRQDGALEVWASTQNPTKTQNFCAYVCGLPANKVRGPPLCRVVSFGFGFRCLWVEVCCYGYGVVVGATPS